MELRFNKDNDYQIPFEELFTIEDVVEEYKELILNKPQQIPIGEYSIRSCDSCTFNGVLHNKQFFCPLCKNKLSDFVEQVDDDFDERLMKWVEMRDNMSDVINGKLELNKFTVKHYGIEIEDNVFGDEVEVNEDN